VPPIVVEAQEPVPPPPSSSSARPSLSDDLRQSPAAWFGVGSLSLGILADVFLFMPAYLAFVGLPLGLLGVVMGLFGTSVNPKGSRHERQPEGESGRYAVTCGPGDLGRVRRVAGQPTPCGFCS
jgi:hypothetical protein